MAASVREERDGGGGEERDREEEANREGRINIRELQENAWFGLKEEDRSISWLILLDIISPDTKRHTKEIEERKKKYKEMVALSLEPITSPDVLSPSGDPEKTIRQIKKDVRRIEEVKDKAVADMYIRSMSVFWRKHIVIGYVQGMCEIFKVFYCVHKERHKEEEAEALSYFCFARIVVHAIDCFGSRQQGIERAIEEIEVLIKKYSPEIDKHFRRIKIEIKYFSYNWMSTFMFREFYQHKKIMDAHFSLGVQAFMQFNICFSISVVLYFRDKILSMDFDNALRTLQSISEYPWEDQDLDRLLSVAYIVFSNGTLC